MRRVEYSIHMVFINGAPGTVAMNGGDTKTDTGSSGRNCIILKTTNRISYIIGFKYSKGKPIYEGVHIGTFWTVYDCPRNQKTYILAHNKMLFFGDDLDHTFLNPNQI